MVHEIELKKTGTLDALQKSICSPFEFTGEKRRRSNLQVNINERVWFAKHEWI